MRILINENDLKNYPMPAGASSAAAFYTDLAPQLQNGPPRDAALVHLAQLHQVVIVRNDEKENNHETNQSKQA
jgi:hypothetical protein